MSSRVKTPEALALGLAVVRFAEYSVHIDDAGVTLVGENSIGYITSVVVNRQANSLQSFGSMGGRVYENKSIVISEAVVVDCAFTELTISNVDAALGGGVIISESSDISGEIGLSSSDAAVHYRVEVEIMLKDSIDMVTFVLPKCRISSNFALSTSMEDLANSPLQFTTVSAYEGAWFGNPLGKIVYHQ